MSQSSRIQSLEDFKDGLAKILIASDVAARGIDVAGLSHVFNYDVPINPEDYVHRIGRTGRAGLKGKAFTFCEDGGEKNILTIEKLIKKNFNYEKINNLYSNLSSITIWGLFDLKKDYNLVNYSTVEIEYQLQKIKKNLMN